MQVPQDPFLALRQDLDLVARSNRRRSLALSSGKDFSSNDYLGLASSAELAGAVRSALERGVPVGSTGSRLLRGNHEEHQFLEAEAAELFGTESALYLSSGYAAASMLLSTLPQRGDLVIADELIHASAHEGLKLTRAEHAFARHNDCDHVEELAHAWRSKNGGGRIWLALESLYSMEGDRAPLAELIAVADREGAILLVDEAHAVGVFGREGRGLADQFERRENVVKLVTCGKALGCEGALVCAPATVREFLINRGRPFIFSTAPSPLMAAAVRASLKLISARPERREHLWRLVRKAEDSLAAIGLEPSGSQILPIILKSEGLALDVAAALQAAGFDIRAIRPPSVPKGTSRLRVTITHHVAMADVASLFSELSAILAPLREPA